ncbi:polysaccharide biosynthesis tyrosine autokinase [Nesterenkonia ebinurensis]|uniref:polysaccharide biosynthesis tyrosine autokinase n=1 Tax=Nesterenkonia ebinurensis TaxID=2608252 RepID=UPI00123DA575|nr:polysaccharide biosynthesis tyrosine autokinase [Nesterenkonia ebinurensis]
MELRDYLHILRKNWIVIGVLVLLGAGSAVAYSLSQTPLYESTSRVMFSSQAGETIGEQQQGQTYTQARMGSYVELATTPRVLDPVIGELELDESAAALADRLAVNNSTNTTIISVTATDEDPAQAAEIANAATSSLTEAVVEAETLPGAEQAPVTITQVTQAQPASSPSSPQIPLNVALGALVGLALGVGVAVLRSTLDTRVRSLRDLQHVTDHPVIGAIPMDPEAKTRPIIMKEDSQDPRSEAFRSLRTNLQFIELDGGNVYTITSSIPREGKSTTAVNLAIALADAGKKTVLIDGDLRKPKVAEYLGIEGGVGLTDVLIGRADLEDVFQQWGNRRLLVLPSGMIPPNPSELLGSQQMQSLLSTVSTGSDVVIIDAPPLLPVTDAAILARQTAGAIVAVSASRTSRGQLGQALENLENVGAKVAGIALTMVPTRGADAYGYNYTYGYGYGYGHGKAAE